MATVQMNADGSAVFSFGDGAAVRDMHVAANGNLAEAHKMAQHVAHINHAVAHGQVPANDTALAGGAAMYQFPQGAAIAHATAPAGADADKVAAQAAALQNINNMMVAPQLAAQAQGSWVQRAGAAQATGTHVGR